MFALTILLDNIVNTESEMHEQEKNNTEQLILEAAEQEFFTKGFGARARL